MLFNSHLRNSPLILSLVFTAGTAFAGSPAVSSKVTQSSQELQALKLQIQKIKKGLNNDRGEHTRLRKKLRRSEVEIEKVLREYSGLETKIQGKNVQIASLKKLQSKQSAVLEKHRDFLQWQIRFGYMQPDQGMMKRLFNGQDPNLLGRMLIYNRYVTEARSEKINAVNDQLADLIAMQDQINQETEELTGLQNSRQKNLQNLREKSQERQQLIARLDERISGKQSRLNEMKNDVGKLQTLITSLKATLAKRTQKKLVGGRFDQLKGKLRWPVRGTIRQRYGTARDDSTLNWQGVLINSKKGEEVRAVSAGQIVFSDWFRNLGRLVIVDHGGGYMTLYGHNQELFHKVGDRVKTADVIATVGDSGGRKNSGLYFEVRRQGNAVDPAIWCRGNF